MSSIARPGLHAGIAEYGKVCALRGDYTNALLCYREAMRMAVEGGAFEVVFRHYLECSLEALEHMGAFGEVLDYCDRAIDHYREHPPLNPLARLDLASIHQRRGVVLLKRGERAEASRAFEAVREAAAGGEARLPLAGELLRWLQGGFNISPHRLEAELARHRYFSVRKETVNPASAVRIPRPAAPTAFAGPGGR
jgi:hypothetical protein